MSSTLDRLRRLNNLRPLRGAARDIDPATNDGPRSRQKALAGDEIVNDLGACLVATHSYPLPTVHGTHPLGTLLQHSPQILGTIYPAFGANHIENFHHAVFLDTETTGLGTGASVYAFMVGIGTFETIQDDTTPQLNSDASTENGGYPLNERPTHFVVRQYFMRGPAEETALLDEVAMRVQDRAFLVTFNGRSFDLPLIRSRLQYNRPFLPQHVLHSPLLGDRAPHVDLLMPARRLWRRRLQSCRLANLEHEILGLERTEADVPGHLIPRMYVEYLQTGDTRDMKRVFYHNREDIVSMVSLATHLSDAYSSRSADQPRRAMPGQDWLSLAIAYEGMSDIANAEPAYLRALDAVADHVDRAEVFQRLGRLRKRQGRWQEAAETWQLWLTSVPGNDPTPYVELAKYYEWQQQDLEQAEMWAAWALHNLHQEESEYAWARTIDELEHRLQRIRRKRQI